MRRLALIENVQREDLSVLEKAKAILDLKGEIGSVEAVAKVVGISERLAYLYARIGETAPEIQELVAKKGLDLRTSDALVSLVKDVAKLDNENKSILLAQALNRETELTQEAIKRLRFRFLGSAFSNETKATAASKGRKAEIFWKSEREYGFDVRVSRKAPLDEKKRRDIIAQAERFFKAIGAKKVDIRF